MNNKIVLGGNLFGYNCNKKDTERLILAAFENGINKIDTSDVCHQISIVHHIPCTVWKGVYTETLS